MTARWWIALALAGCAARTGLIDDEIASRAADAGRPPNACGGEEELDGVPGASCGECAVWRCDGPNALRCSSDGLRNACGECGPLPEEECNGRDDDCDGELDEGCVVRLTTGIGTGTRARIAGDRVVVESRPRASNASDVVLVELPGRATTYLSAHSDPPGLSTDPSQDYAPAIGGAFAAWIERSVDPFRDGGRLIVLDLQSGERTVASTRRSDAPAVDASGRVVFESPGTARSESDIWLWDAGELTMLTGPRADEREPDIDGDRVVFTRGDGTSPLFNRAIVVRDLRTGAERVLSEGLAGWQTMPAIDGDRVVWRREEGGRAPGRFGEIWLYDLRTDQRRRLDASEPAHATEPRIDGERVCWNTTSEVVGGVTVLDLRTDRRRVYSVDGQHCDLDGDRVIWRLGGGGGDVYMRRLRPDEP